MVDENRRNWCELTPYVTFAYNTSCHCSTTFSLFYLLYLREARIPIDLVMENVVKSYRQTETTEMRSRMEQALQMVRDQLDQAF